VVLPRGGLGFLFSTDPGVVAKAIDVGQQLRLLMDNWLAENPRSQVHFHLGVLAHLVEVWFRHRTSSRLLRRFLPCARSDQRHWHFYHRL
jgi:hypothetical protein